MSRAQPPRYSSNKPAGTKDFENFYAKKKPLKANQKEHHGNEKEKKVFT